MLTVEEVIDLIASIPEQHADASVVLPKVGEWVTARSNEAEGKLGDPHESLAQKLSKVMLTIAGTSDDDDTHLIRIACHISPSAVGNLLYTTALVMASLMLEAGLDIPSSTLDDLPPEFREWHSKEDKHGHE